MMKNNLGLKIVALVMAVFFWLQITLLSQHESKTSLPLKLVNATGEDSLRQSPRRIATSVYGRGLDILRLRYSQAHIQMNAADFWAGNAADYLALDVPEKLNVKVLGVMPPTLAEHLSEAGQARDENAHSAAKNGKKAPSAAGTEPSQSDSEEGQLQTKILTDLVITPPQGVKIFPPQATLKVKGNASLLAGLPSGVRVFAASQPDAGGQYKLRYEVPEGITVLDITPKQVRASR